MSDERLVSDDEIVSSILGFHSDTQAVYLFGSYGTEYVRPDSDVDIALLLPHARSKELGSLALDPCVSALADLFNRPMDLINLRSVDTVFQIRIIETGRLLYGDGAPETSRFEMLTLSFYQKLNEERADIIEDIIRTGRVFAK